MSPEKWDPYNLSLVDNFIDWVQGWAEYYAEQLDNLWKRIFGE